jgi:hypothetical protein
MTFSQFVKNLRRRKGAKAIGEFFRSGQQRRDIQAVTGTMSSSASESNMMVVKVCDGDIKTEVKVHKSSLVSAVRMKCRLPDNALLCFKGIVLEGSEELSTLGDGSEAVELVHVVDVPSSGSETEGNMEGSSGVGSEVIDDDPLIFTPPPKRHAAGGTAGSGTSGSPDSSGSSSRARAPRFFGVSPSSAASVPGFAEMQERMDNYSVRPAAVLEINGVTATRAHSWSGTARQLLRLLKELDIVDTDKEMCEMKHLADHDTAEQIAYFILEDMSLAYRSKTRLNKLNNYVSILRFMCRECDKLSGYFYQTLNRSWLNASLAVVQDARDIARRRDVAAGGGAHFIEQWKEKGIWLSMEEWRQFIRKVKEEAERQASVIDGGGDSAGQLERFGSIVLVLLAITSGPQRTQVYVSMRMGDVSDDGSSMFIKIRWEKNTLRQFERAAARGSAGTMRTLPVVDPECITALRRWMQYRRKIAVSDFVFVSKAGQGLKDNGMVACLVKSVTFPISKRPLTMLTLRHLKCTHFLSAVNSNSSLSESQKQELIKSHASWMGHTVDTMIQFYVVRGTEQAAQADAVVMRKAMLHIGI